MSCSFDPKQIKENIISLVKKRPKVIVGYSGGLDSTVLLHILVSIRDKLPKFQAIYVNHGVSAKSKVWARHCLKVCEKHDVEFAVHQVDLPLKFDGHSFEELLRQLRYDIFAKLLPTKGVLFTAHHADDQAETLLLQLFRGAGVKGLAAMPEKMTFARGHLVRPFLGVMRSDLLTYAKRHKLSWVDDESNLDIRFDRNYLRNRLLPVVKKRWPSVVNVLNRVSKNLAEADSLLAELASDDLARVLISPGVIDLNLLQNFNVLRQKNILRYWFSKLGLSYPSYIKLSEILKNVINSRYDAMPKVAWSGSEVRRFRNFIYAMRPLEVHDSSVELSFSSWSLTLPSHLGVLTINRKLFGNLDRSKVKVRFRRGGEKLKIKGRSGTHELKKLMQEWQIPPWLRDRIPLVYYDKKLVAVVGYYRGQGSGLSIQHLNAEC